MRYEYVLESVQKQLRVNPGISLAHVGYTDVAHVNVSEASGSLGLSNEKQRQFDGLSDISTGIDGDPVFIFFPPLSPAVKAADYSLPWHFSEVQASLIAVEDLIQSVAL